MTRRLSLCAGRAPQHPPQPGFMTPGPGKLFAPQDIATALQRRFHLPGSSYFVNLNADRDNAGGTNALQPYARVGNLRRVRLYRRGAAGRHLTPSPMAQRTGRMRLPLRAASS